MKNIKNAYPHILDCCNKRGQPAII